MQQQKAKVQAQAMCLAPQVMHALLHPTEELAKQLEEQAQT